jgi:TolB protein
MLSRMVCAISILKSFRLMTCRFAMSAMTLASFASFASFASLARADDPPLPETPLGTVDVTGAGGGIVLQHLTVVLRPESAATPRSESDLALMRVVRNDLQLSGQFEVSAEAKVPSVLSEAESTQKEPVRSEDTLAGYASTGNDIVVRVKSETSGNVLEAFADIYFAKSGKKAATPNLRAIGPKEQARLIAHKISDAVLGALSGTQGAFASQLTFISRANNANAQQVFVADADGFGMRGYGPAGQVALSPDFGPGGSVYYALSRNQSPFRFTEGENAEPVPWPIVRGNILGVAFAADKKTLALTVSSNGINEILLRAPDGNARTLPSPPNAHHPAFGPQNKLAWVAGSPPRVIIDGSFISPAGLAASSPTFCESPQGLLVVFSLASGRDSALYATDVKGNGLRRLTSTGRDDSPACSADGRLIAYFSRRAQNPGLYVMPILIPARTQRIAADVGSSLRWGRPERSADKSL